MFLIKDFTLVVLGTDVEFALTQYFIKIMHRNWCI